MGKFRVLLLLVVALLLLLVATGESRRITPKDQKRSKIRKILKKINKPAVKTIYGVDGHVIDCVDVYKQPTMDHPSMKDHVIQMEPTFVPDFVKEVRRRRKDMGLENEPPVAQKWHDSGRCPHGTIPIRRVKESELAAAPSLERFGKRPPRYGVTTPDTFKEEMAGVRIIDGKSLPNGVGGSFQLWRPDLVLPNEYSLNSIAIGSFPDVEQNMIEMGYGIHEGIFRDNGTHFYIFWTRDAGQTTGCYNLMCEGFVQTSFDFAFGTPAKELSTYNGSTVWATMNVWREKDKTKWWLNLEGHDIGYFPERFFTHLRKSTFHHWGGFVLNERPRGEHTPTKMGSGHFAGEGKAKAASMTDIVGYDFYYKVTPPDAAEYTPFQSQQDCYSVKDMGKSTKWPFGYTIYYGGPGGPECDLSD